MPWNSTWPDGTKSVRANTLPGQQNTSYTETTMNIDHFWNDGTNKDGHHRQMQLPFTGTSSVPTDIVLDGSMDGGLYLRAVNGGSNQEAEIFYLDKTPNQYLLNVVQPTPIPYQLSPCFKTGTINFANASSFFTITAIPANSYGEIFIWKDGTRVIQAGTFISDGTIVEGYSYLNFTSVISVNLGNFSNSTPIDLNLKGKGAASGLYNYRIIYRGI